MLCAGHRLRVLSMALVVIIYVCVLGIYVHRDSEYCKRERDLSAHSM